MLGVHVHRQNPGVGLVLVYRAHQGEHGGRLSCSALWRDERDDDTVSYNSSFGSHVPALARFDGSLSFAPSVSHHYCAAQRAAPRCPAPRCGAMKRNAAHGTATQRPAPRSSAPRSSAQQPKAAQCGVRQRNAARGSALRRDAARSVAIQVRLGNAAHRSA